MRFRDSSHRRPALTCVIVACVLVGPLSACGKKGPPLAPFVRVPAGVQGGRTARLGNDIFITFTLPSANVDRSTPVDLASVEVYAYTGAVAPTVGTFVPRATRLAVIPVQPSAEAQGSGGTPASEATTDAVVAGATLTVVDPNGAPVGADMHRFYLVIPFSTRGRPGPPHTPLDVVLAPVPPPPTDLAASYSATSISLTWTPAASLTGSRVATNLYLEAPQRVLRTPWEQGRPQPVNRDPVTATSFVEPVVFGAERCYVARSVVVPVPEREPATATEATQIPSTAPGSPGTLAPPLLPEVAAVSPTPVDAPAPSRPLPERRSTGAATPVPRATTSPVPVGAESEASARVCVTPVDRFPPAAPVQLVVVATPGAMNLVWEANSEPDLGGYHVLRGVAGDLVLRVLTPMPTGETRFTDTTVVPGMRYVYAVVAVDRQVPTPNTSAESARVEEAAQ